MNWGLTAASVLCVLLAVVHSALGERLVFAPLRQNGDWRAEALSLLDRQRWRAIRATWHLISIIGLGIGAVLFVVARGEGPVATILGVTFTVAAAYWATATRMKHPAWLVLGLIGGILLAFS